MDCLIWGWLATQHCRAAVGIKGMEFCYLVYVLGPDAECAPRTAKSLSMRPPLRIMIFWKDLFLTSDYRFY